MLLSTWKITISKPHLFMSIPNPCFQAQEPPQKNWRKYCVNDRNSAEEFHTLIAHDPIGLLNLRVVSFFQFTHNS